MKKLFCLLFFLEIICFSRIYAFSFNFCAEGFEFFRSDDLDSIPFACYEVSFEKKNLDLGNGKEPTLKLTITSDDNKVTYGDFFSLSHNSSLQRCDVPGLNGHETASTWFLVNKWPNRPQNYFAFFFDTNGFVQIIIRNTAENSKSYSLYGLCSTEVYMKFVLFITGIDVNLDDCLPIKSCEFIF